VSPARLGSLPVVVRILFSGIYRWVIGVLVPLHAYSIAALWHYCKIGCIQMHPVSLYCDQSDAIRHYCDVDMRLSSWIHVCITIHKNISLWNPQVLRYAGALGARYTLHGRCGHTWGVLGWCHLFLVSGLKPTGFVVICGCLGGCNLKIIMSVQENGNNKVLIHYSCHHLRFFSSFFHAHRGLQYLLRFRFGIVVTPWGNFVRFRKHILSCVVMWYGRTKHENSTPKIYLLLQKGLNKKI